MTSWGRQWHPTLVLLPGKSHGWRSLVGYGPWGLTESDTTGLLHFHALEKEMATRSSVLAWRIPGTGEPGGLPSMGLYRVRNDWSDLAAAAKWQLIISLSIFFLILPINFYDTYVQYFGHLMWRTDSLGKIEGRRRRGWHKMWWLDGITNLMDMSLRKIQDWWWTGKPGMLQSMGHKESDMTKQLNWTEIILSLCTEYFIFLL